MNSSFVDLVAAQRPNFDGLIASASSRIQPSVMEIIDKANAVFSEHREWCCLLPLAKTYPYKAVDLVMDSLRRESFQIFKSYRASTEWCIVDKLMLSPNTQEKTPGLLHRPEKWLSWKTLKIQITPIVADQVLALAHQINEVFKEEQRSGFWYLSVTGKVAAEVEKIVMTALEDHEGVRVFKEHGPSKDATFYVFHVAPVHV